MGSRIIRLAAAAAVAAAATYLGASCLSVDTDKSCGEGEPPCYKGEVCYAGRCYQRGALPPGADADDGGGTGDTATDGGRDSTPDPDTGPDVGPDTRTDTAPSDVEPTDTSDAGGQNCEVPADAIQWPVSNYCAKLESLTSAEKCGLESEWNESEADAGTGSDAGGLPGATCTSEKDCVGKCRTSSESAVDDQCAHQLFTTSETFDGDFKPSAGADPLRQADCACQLLAVRAGLEGTYQSLLSTRAESASDRIRLYADVYAPTFGSETMIFERYEGSVRKSLWEASLNNPPEYDETGSRSRMPGAAWTGWPGDEGRSTANCQNWSAGTNNPQGLVGDPGQTLSGDWLHLEDRSCNDSYPIYCIQQQPRNTP